MREKTAERGRERKRTAPTISGKGRDSKERENTGYRQTNATNIRGTCTDLSTFFQIFPSFISFYDRKDTHTHTHAKYVKYTSTFVSSLPFIAFFLSLQLASPSPEMPPSREKRFASKRTCHLRRRIYRPDGCAISRLNSSDNIFIPLIMRLSMALFLILVNARSLSLSSARFSHCYQLPPV